MICRWKPLFGLELCGHFNTCLSFEPLGLRKPQKVPRRCPRTFPIQQRYKLQHNHREISQRNLKYHQSFRPSQINWKVHGHLLGTFWGFQNPNGSAEGNELRCLPRLCPNPSAKSSSYINHRKKLPEVITLLI